MQEINKFFKCSICGNVAERVHDGGVTMSCCNKKMDPLSPNTVEASIEKHVPVVKCDNGELIVEVGSTLHPMEEKHYIEWIQVFQNKKVMRVALRPGDEPKARFCIEEGEFTVLAYCNLHGLWKAEGKV